MKIRNNMAAFGWGFSAVFLLMCAAFTHILIRDGTSRLAIYPPDIPDFYPPWFMPVVLAVFWIAGLALGAHVASKPCVSVEVKPDRSVVVRHRDPFGRSERHFGATDVQPARVMEDTDDEGDPYFRVMLVTADGVMTCIAEGHDRGHCEAVCRQFNDAIGRPHPTA